jgi:hypothetical protein
MSLLSESLDRWFSRVYLYFPGCNSEIKERFVSVLLDPMAKVKCLGVTAASMRESSHKQNQFRGRWIDSQDPVSPPLMTLEGDDLVDYRN